MIPAPTLPWFELARFRRSRVTRAAVVAVLLVPLFYGALYVWANIDPTGRLDHVRAAVVNQDKIVEIEGTDGKQQPVAVGRQLAGNLVANDDKDNYDWVLTDAADARQGLADGDYKAVLTIPEDLSKAATSTSGDPQEAVQGNLDLKTNDAVNYVNGAIAQTILRAAKGALNAQVTETYLDNVYLSFSDIKMALSDAADGATELADGAGQLATGADELDSGAQELAGGLGELDERTSALPGATRQLADGARQVSRGTAEINELVQGVTSGINGSKGEAKSRIDEVAASLRTLAEECRAADPAPADCDAIAGAAEQAAGLKGVVDEVADRADDYAGQTQRLADGAAQVADGNAQLAGQVPALVDAIGQAAGGAQQLADGTGQLSDGAAELAGGARTLRDGLDDGSEQVPDYTDSERERLAETAATPVEDAAERVNAVKNYGEALAPYFIALALWVGAMAIYLLLRPLSARAIASTTGSIRTALAGYVPGVALSVVQVALLLVVLQGVLDISAANGLLLVGMALTAGAVFTAINQMFVALFGPAGRFAALVFVCLQLTAAGGTYPVETAPRFFGFLHDLMPMTYVVHGLRAAIAGGGEGVTTDFAALAAFGVLALCVTVLAARRRQTVTMSRLHPTLVV